MFPLCHMLLLGLPSSVSQLGHVQVLWPLRDVHASVNVLGSHQRDTGDWRESQRCREVPAEQVAALGPGASGELESRGGV